MSGLSKLPRRCKVAGFVGFFGWFVLIVGKQIFRGHRIVPAKMPTVEFWLIQVGGAVFLAVLLMVAVAMLSVFDSEDTK